MSKWINKFFLASVFLLIYLSSGNFVAYAINLQATPSQVDQGSTVSLFANGCSDRVTFFYTPPNSNNEQYVGAIADGSPGAAITFSPADVGEYSFRALCGNGTDTATSNINVISKVFEGPPAPDISRSSNISDSGDCEIIYDPTPLEIGNTLKNNSSRVYFHVKIISPSARSSRFDVVWEDPKIGVLGGDREIGLIPRSADGELQDSAGNPPSRTFSSAQTGSLSAGNHSFAVRRQGSAGDYCHGNYQVSFSKGNGAGPGDIQSCTLNFPDNPTANQDITINGTIQPGRQESKLYKLMEKQSGATWDISPDISGNFTKSIGKVNSGTRSFSIIVRTFDTEGKDQDTQTSCTASCTLGNDQGQCTQTGDGTEQAAVEQKTRESKEGPTCNPGDNNCSKAAGNFCDEDGKSLRTAIGCIPTDPQGLIGVILNFAIGLGGVISLLFMIIGAFKMITSAGSAEALKAGQDQFTSAVIGLLFVIFSVLLLQILGGDILNIPGFEGTGFHTTQPDSPGVGGYD
jgi:hypothetical protein